MNWNRTQTTTTILPLLAACALTACGGGGGEVQSGPAPVTPSPTPSPTPQPTSTAGPAGLYPLPSDKPMVAFGGGVTESESGTAAFATAVSYGQSQMQIDYDPATQDYAITIPNYPEGRSIEDTEDSTPDLFHRFFYLVNPATKQRVGFLNVDRKAQLNLTYTTLGWFGGHRLAADGTALNDQIYFAAGIPTVAGDVPLSGTASYAAVAKGWVTAGTNVEGKLQLTFDFATSDVRGRLDLSANDGTGGFAPVGSYPVAQAAHAQGATGFSGTFDAGNIGPGDASFEGAFMGPGAAEIGGRWRVPLRIPSGQGFPSYLEGLHSAAGAFAGARQ